MILEAVAQLGWAFLSGVGMSAGVFVGLWVQQSFLMTIAANVSRASRQIDQGTKPAAVAEPFQDEFA